MHYQSVDGALHFLESAEFEYLLPPGSVKITEKKAAAIRLASIPKEQALWDFQTAIQSHLDEKARASGYDDIKSAVTYAEEPAVPRFQAEGQAFRAWRSRCWAYGYEQLAKVESKERERPTIEQLIAELPALEMP